MGQLVGPCGAQRVSLCCVYTCTDGLNWRIQCESQKDLSLLFTTSLSSSLTSSCLVNAKSLELFLYEQR